MLQIVSAATHTVSSKHKITNHANKIFELSRYAPIGICICGDLDFLGMPWEDIFILYRKKILYCPLNLRADSIISKKVMWQPPHNLLS